MKEEHLMSANVWASLLATDAIAGVGGMGEVLRFSTASVEVGGDGGERPRICCALRKRRVLGSV